MIYLPLAKFLFDNGVIVKIKTLKVDTSRSLTINKIINYVTGSDVSNYFTYLDEVYCQTSTTALKTDGIEQQLWIIKSI